jgi:hypothetical protein
LLTDANDGIEQAGTFPPGIDYRAAAGTVTAIIPSVPQGVSGTVTFSININANLQAQSINNTAQFQTATQVSTNTNTASYQVLQAAAVVANGSPSSSVNFPTAGSGEPVTVPSAAAGSTFSFNNYIWNRGNGTDTFDITIQSNNFPAGTSVTLLQQDGVTSLVNSSGSGAPDTGPVPGVGPGLRGPVRDRRHVLRIPRRGARHRPGHGLRRAVLDHQARDLGVQQHRVRRRDRYAHADRGQHGRRHQQQRA